MDAGDGPAAAGLRPDQPRPRVPVVWQHLQSDSGPLHLHAERFAREGRHADLEVGVERGNVSSFTRDIVPNCSSDDESGYAGINCY